MSGIGSGGSSSTGFAAEFEQRIHGADDFSAAQITGLTSIQQAAISGHARQYAGGHAEHFIERQRGSPSRARLEARVRASSAAALSLSPIMSGIMMLFGGAVSATSADASLHAAGAGAIQAD